MMTIKQNLKVIRDKLKELVEFYNICGLKAGTEIEDMSFEEITLLQNICYEIVPLTVKIGGPEARNDIRFLLKQGIDGVLGPMIESAYSFDNYMNTLNSMSGLNKNTFSIVAINIETITAYKNQKFFEQSQLYPFLTNITVGRTDLSSSMGLHADHDIIFQMTRDIVARARKTKKITSVGGSITVDSVERIFDEVAPHRINTRHVVLELQKKMSPDFLRKSILKILQFEISLYRVFAKIQPDKKRVYEKRVETTLNRMNTAKRKLSA